MNTCNLFEYMQFIYTPVPFIYMHVISKIRCILLANNTSYLKSEAKEFSEELDRVTT